MPLTEGYDIVLEQVKRDGLPENRAIWKYIVTLPPGVYKEVCIDFKGKIEGLTNPAKKTSLDSSAICRYTLLISGLLIRRSLTLDRNGRLSAGNSLLYRDIARIFRLGCRDERQTYIFLLTKYSMHQLC